LTEIFRGLLRTPALERLNVALTLAIIIQK
jgi:hypothetical protein